MLLGHQTLSGCHQIVFIWFIDIIWRKKNLIWSFTKSMNILQTTVKSFATETMFFFASQVTPFKFTDQSIVSFLAYKQCLVPFFLTSFTFFSCSWSVSESLSATFECWHKEWHLRLETLQTLDQQTNRQKN